MLRESLLYPRQLDPEEIADLDFDDYSPEEIRYMIDCGMIPPISRESA